MNPSLHISQPAPNPAFHVHPAQLFGKARAQHVVSALLTYNQGIIENNPKGANSKFEKLNQSPFVFLRGTADLMYQDFEGTDGDKPVVLCMGDVHLENYGVMETESGDLIWGLNDFDEADFAPFIWDVKRGATSTILAANENDFDSKDCFMLAQSFASAYLRAIQYGLGKKKIKVTFDILNAPKLIKKTIKKALKVQPSKWLEKDYLQPDVIPPQFKKTDEIQPLPKSLVKQRAMVIEKALENYLASLRSMHQTDLEKIEVLDLATKTGSGTGSIGLWRYYALVKAFRAGHTELLILEIKQERPSVLTPYVPKGPLLFPSEGSRVAFAENIQLPKANHYYGYTTLFQIGYLVRERSPHKKSVKLKKLTKFKDFESYVQACGSALAFAHLRANLALNEEGPETNKRMLLSIDPDTFAGELAYFSITMANRVIQDWKSFKKAFLKGLFTF